MLLEWEILMNFHKALFCFIDQRDRRLEVSKNESTLKFFYFPVFDDFFFVVSWQRKRVCHSLVIRPQGRMAIIGRSRRPLVVAEIETSFHI